MYYSNANIKSISFIHNEGYNLSLHFTELPLNFLTNTPDPTHLTISTGELEYQYKGRIALAN